jgi:hypothetical protein
MPEQSILDARLAEIDRRLKVIQSGLAPATEEAPPEPEEISAERAAPPRLTQTPFPPAPDTAVTPRSSATPGSFAAPGSSAAPRSSATPVPAWPPTTSPVAGRPGRPQSAPAAPPVAPPAPPVAPAAPPAAPAGPAPADGAAGDVGEARRLVIELRELQSEHQQVLVAARRMLSTLADALAQLPQSSSASAESSAITVSAGPFAGTDALRDFKESLVALPSVREVAVREFQGDDHAVLDVRLGAAKP